MERVENKNLPKWVQWAIAFLTTISLLVYFYFQLIPHFIRTLEFFRGWIK